MSDAPSERARSTRARQDAIRNLLLEHWGPIGAAGTPRASDEYDGYIRQVHGMLLGRASRDRLADYLEWIETKAMRLVSSRPRTMRTVDALLEIAERLAPATSHGLDSPEGGRSQGHMASATGRPPSMNIAFVIAGRDIDPDDVTRTVGLEPTRLWHATNETVLKDPRMSTVNWSVGRRNVASYEVDEAVRQVLDIVWPHREGIQHYRRSREAKACLVCNVTIREDRPVYSLSAETMSRLAALDCEFVLDIYDYSR